MRRPINYSLLILPFILFSCSIWIEDEKPFDGEIDIPFSSSTRAAVSFDSDLYYHEELGLVLRAYDIFDNPQVHKVDDREDGITHLGVKFYPKDIKQQRSLSTSNVASVTYVPFGFNPVSPEGLDIKQLPAYPEHSPYQIDNSQYRTTAPAGESLAPKTTQLPIMYALWPINEPLPEGVEYEVCFKVKEPQEEESGSTRSLGSNLYNIEFLSYDSLLLDYVPLNKLEVQLIYDIYSASYFTDSTGFASMSPSHLLNVPSNNQSDIAVFVVLETEDWAITLNNGTTPIHQYIGTAGSMWFSSTPTTFTCLRTSNTTEYEIHRAVDYYFNSNHDLSTNISSYEHDRRIIHAMNSPGVDDTMSATGISMDAPIFVYNGFSSQKDCIASVLHELGHVRMMKHKQDFSLMSSTPALIESYASFIGWYLGNQYYTSKGFTFPYTGYEISYQGRQDWLPGYNDNYTPFFVDLVDDYNQLVINDPIYGYTPAWVDGLGLTYSSITDCGSYLYSLFPSSDLLNYLSFYTGL